MNELLRDFAKLKEQKTTVAVQFIETELGLALTFCEIAASTDNSEKRQRNVRNAHKAYQGAKETLEQLAIDKQVRATVDSLVARVRDRLAVLGVL